MSIHSRFGWPTTAIVMIAVVWGFVIAGSPGTERLRKFDERRLEDLRVIQNEIYTIVVEFHPNGTVTLKKPLPATLNDVVAQAQYQRPTITDPETRATYEYSIVNTSTFDLCATFHFVRDDVYDISWNHDAGRQCFRFDATDAKRVPTKPIPAEVHVSEPI